jgi:hypothetical protein
VDPEISRQFRMKRTGEDIILSHHHDLILMSGKDFHFSVHFGNDRSSDEYSVECFVKAFN